MRPVYSMFRGKMDATYFVDPPPPICFLAPKARHEDMPYRIQ